jgi:hypothetical protein
MTFSEGGITPGPPCGLAESPASYTAPPADGFAPPRRGDWSLHSSSSAGSSDGEEAASPAVERPFVRSALAAATVAAAASASAAAPVPVRRKPVGTADEVKGAK